MPVGESQYLAGLPPVLEIVRCFVKGLVDSSDLSLNISRDSAISRDVDTCSGLLPDSAPAAEISNSGI